MNAESEFEKTLRKLPAEDVAFLQRACAEQPALLAAMEALLKAKAPPDTPINEAARAESPPQWRGFWQWKKRVILLAKVFLVCAIVGSTLGLTQTKEKQEAARIKFEAAEARRAVAAKEDALVKARAVYKNLVAEFPKVPAHLKKLADTHNNLGTLLQEQGKFAEAQAEYEGARTSLKKLVKLFPARPDCHKELGLTHAKLGNLFKAVGKTEQAKSEMDAASAILLKASLLESDELDRQFQKMQAAKAE